MRILLLALLITQLACADTPWWKREQDRYRHVEGWTAPLPLGWKHTVDGDYLSLNSPDGKLMLVLMVFDSQREVEDTLAPMYADLRQSNGGKVPRARRCTGRTGLHFVRRVQAMSDRQVGLVHVLRPGSPSVHLVAMYCVKTGAVPDSIDEVLKGLEQTGQ